MSDHHIIVVRDADALAERAAEGGTPRRYEKITVE